MVGENTKMLAPLPNGIGEPHRSSPQSGGVRGKARHSTFSVGPLLDYGMRMYRHHFATFVIAGSIWALPITGLMILFEIFQGRAFPIGGIFLSPLILASDLLSLAALPLLAVLGLTMIYALSHIAAVADAGQDPSWRMAWRIRPLRIVGMGLVSLVYAVLAGIVVVLCSCIAGLLIVGAGSLFSDIFDGSEPDLEFIILLVMTAGLTFYSLVIFLVSTLWAGLCYTFQPLIQDDGPILPAVGTGLSALLSHFRENVRLCAAAALTAGGFGLSITVSLTVLALLPFALYGASDQVIQIVVMAVSLISMVITSPPLCIWMALAYRQRRSQEIKLALLEQRIAQMHQSSPA